MGPTVESHIVLDVIQSPLDVGKFPRAEFEFLKYQQILDYSYFVIVNASLSEYAC